MIIHIFLWSRDCAVLLLLLIRWLMLPDSTCDDLHRATPRSRPSSAQLILPYVPRPSSSHVLINARGEIASYFASVLITPTIACKLTIVTVLQVHDRRPSDRDYRRIRVNLAAFTNRGRHAFLANRLEAIARDKGWKFVTRWLQLCEPREVSRESQTKIGRQANNLNKAIPLARNATRDGSLSHLKTSRLALRLGAITLCPDNRWSNLVTAIVPSGILPLPRQRAIRSVLSPLFLIFMRQLIRRHVTSLSRNVSSRQWGHYIRLRAMLDYIKVHNETTV